MRRTTLFEKPQNDLSLRGYVTQTNTGTHPENFSHQKREHFLNQLLRVTFRVRRMPMANSALVTDACVRRWRAFSSAAQREGWASLCERALREAAER